MPGRIWTLANVSLKSKTYSKSTLFLPSWRNWEPFIIAVLREQNQEIFEGLAEKKWTRGLRSTIKKP